MGLFEIFNVVLFGWFVGFLTYAFIDMFSMRKQMEKERVRHDLAMARIKAVKSVTR